MLFQGHFGFNTKKVSYESAFALCDSIAAEILLQDSLDVDGNVIPGLNVPSDLVGFAFNNIDLTEVTGGDGKPLVDPTSIRGNGPGSGRWLFRLSEVEIAAVDEGTKPVQFHKVNGERCINLETTSPIRLARLQAAESALVAEVESEIENPMEFLLNLAKAIKEETGENAEWIADLLSPPEPDEEGWEEL